MGIVKGLGDEVVRLSKRLDDVRETADAARLVGNGLLERLDIQDLKAEAEVGVCVCGCVGVWVGVGVF